MVFFHPSSPRYQRGVVIAQWVVMGVGATAVFLTNWGTREHIFSPVQRFLIPHLDNFFQLTEEEKERAKLNYLSTIGKADKP